MLRTSVWILHQCQNVFQRAFWCNIGRTTCATRDPIVQYRGTLVEYKLKGAVRFTSHQLLIMHRLNSFIVSIPWQMANLVIYVQCLRYRVRYVKKAKIKVCLLAVFIFAVVIAFMDNYSSSDEPIRRTVTHCITGRYNSQLIPWH